MALLEDEEVSISPSLYSLPYWSWQRHRRWDHGGDGVMVAMVQWRCDGGNGGGSKRRGGNISGAAGGGGASFFAVVIVVVAEVAKEEETRCVLMWVWAVVAEVNE